MTGYVFWSALVAAAAVWGEWPNITARYRRWRQQHDDLRRVRHAADHWHGPRCLP